MLNESKLRSKFTRWYYNKGYSYKYTFGRKSQIEAKFVCPFWVLPLARRLFSPSIYFMMRGLDMMKCMTLEYKEQNDDTKKEV